MKIKVLSIFIIFLLFMLLMINTSNAKEYTPEDVVLIGKVVHHEAGNQSDLGKRLVIDTILNRVESDQFPNTVKGVLNQPGQYCNPKKYPPSDIYKIIAEEITTRTNPQVLWYRTGSYHKFGIPLVKEGAHYFSGGM